MLECQPTTGRTRSSTHYKIIISTIGPSRWSRIHFSSWSSQWFVSATPISSTRYQINFSKIEPGWSRNYSSRCAARSFRTACPSGCVLSSRKWNTRTPTADRVVGAFACRKRFAHISATSWKQFAHISATSWKQFAHISGTSWKRFAVSVGAVA